MRTSLTTAWAAARGRAPRGPTLKAPPAVLAGPRVRLRDFASADAAEFARYRRDPRCAAFYAADTVAPAASLRLLERFVAWAVERPRRNFGLAIAEPAGEDEPGRLIGCCSLFGGRLPQGYAEFGIELAPERWGRGLAGEASRLLLDFGFGALGLAEIRCVTVTQNVRIARLLGRLGFTPGRPRRAPPGADWLEAAGWTLTDWWLLRAKSRRWRRA